MKLSDYVVDFVYRQGVSDIFMLSGGGCMHLVDSVGTHGKINYICNLHEQACAMAAEGYARQKNGLAACLVTTGPGATNTITGLIGAWLDSVPIIFISGQVKRETMRPFPELRQLGDQEINIIDIVKPVTKYALTVMDAKDIKYHLEKAVFLATHGRPGPVWLDIPLDIQAAQIDVAALAGFDPKELADNGSPQSLKQQVHETARLLSEAKRPVIIAGKGIRIAGAQGLFRQLVDKIHVPVVVSFSGYDVIESNHPYCFGGQGTIGPRVGNFIVQNADLLLCIGTRMNTRMVSYNYAAFARAAKKIVVDIDEAELRKPTFKPDLPIATDAKDFLELLLGEIRSGIPESKEWLDYCNRMKAKYPAVKKEHYDEKGNVNQYAFVHELSRQLKENSTIVLANGFACMVPYQAFDVKKDQRIIVNSGCASMGYDLPAAIGACVANGKKDVVCLAGDGSIQMNIQELQTIKHYDLPIKIFVLNNNGYLSIRETQKNYFQCRYIAACPEHGVSFPDMGKIAVAYGIPYLKIEDNGHLFKVKDVLAAKGPIICELIVPPDKGLEVKAASAMGKDGKMKAKPLEELFPFLSEEELKENMLIELWHDNTG